jgi:hypothetical protein
MSHRRSVSGAAQRTCKEGQHDEWNAAVRAA